MLGSFFAHMAEVVRDYTYLRGAIIGWDADPRKVLGLATELATELAKLGFSEEDLVPFARAWLNGQRGESSID